MRTLMRVTAAVALLLAGPSLVAPTAHADMPEIGFCEADAVLVQGASGPSVVCLQWALLWMRYYRGPLSGQYDDATSQGVVRFQLKNPPLTVNGEANAQTLKAMGIYSGVEKAPALSCTADAPIQSGDRGPSAECMQKKLQAKNFFNGRVDGAVGADTVAAVKAFQLGNPPLKVTGIADARTLAALGVWSGFTTDAKGAALNTKWWPAPPQAEPNWRVVGGVPTYGNRHPCSMTDANTIATEFAKDGADVATQQYFIYIASRESNCNYLAVNQNATTKDDSHCAFQLNALAGMFEPTGELGRRGWTTDSVKLSMKNCADAASDLWVFCARGPWTPPYSCTPPWSGDLGPQGDV